jgi:penicillin-insensitive murein endopeptidase
MKYQTTLRLGFCAVGLLVCSLSFRSPVFAAEGSLLMRSLTSQVAETPFPGPARSIGSPANGCISGAVALPLSGRGWETLRPERNRFWGNPALIRFIEEKAGQTVGLGRLLIGDVAQPRGGHMASGHGSHQTGIDVDIFYRLSNHPLSDEERTAPVMIGVLAEDGSFLPERWGRDQVALLRAFATDARVERIFVNPMIKKNLCNSVGENREWLHVLRPWWGHDDHFHVRIQCPEGDEDCVSGQPVPPGDGCGPELESWISSGDWHSRPKPSGEPQKIRRPEMPEACRDILEGGR